MDKKAIVCQLLTICKNSSGFTLLEVVLVLAIIGTLSTIAIPSVVQYIESSKRVVCNVNSVYS